MAKTPSLPHVKFVRANGKTYAYFNTGEKVNGKPVYRRLPDFGAPGFFESYGAFKAGRTKRQAPEYTIRTFVEDFKASADYLSKARATQDLYRYQFDKLVDLIGRHPIGRVEAHFIRKIVTEAKWGAGTKNAFLSAVGALYAWGRKHDKTTLRPVEDIDKFAMGQHEPWPDHVVEAALVCDNERVRLAVHILYFTGLRIGDACAVRWRDISGGVLTVTPEKTKRHKKTLEITLASELKAQLERTSVRGLTILTDPAGDPVRVDTLRQELQAFTRKLGHETVPHGLRKNAVITLLESGCTIAEVAAITGQSYKIVEHYAARVNNRKLGQAAMLKFEAKRKGNA